MYLGAGGGVEICSRELSGEGSYSEGIQLRELLVRYYVIYSTVRILVEA